MYDINIYYDNKQIAYFELDGYGDDAIDYQVPSGKYDKGNNGFLLTSDSFFCAQDKISYPYCWENYTSDCSGFSLSYYNSCCRNRHVVFATCTLNNVSKYDLKNEVYLYYNGINNSLIFYISQNRPSSNDIKLFMNNITTAGKHNFKVLYGHYTYHGDPGNHNNENPSIREMELEIKIDKNNGTIYEEKNDLIDLFPGHYERSLFIDYLWGNKNIGSWYPSDDVTLVPYLNNLNLQINFKNGDTPLSGNKINIRYNQKYSYCFHGLFNPAFVTKSLFHPAEGHYDYNKDEWIEDSPSYYESIYKYWYDVNKNDLTIDP